MGREKNCNSCIVKNCDSRAKTNVNVHFHSFPKKKRYVYRENLFGNLEKIDQLEAWKSVLKIKNVTPAMKVCSLHFKRDDYLLPDFPAGNRILIRTAVPSLNLPYSKKVNEKSNKARQERRLKRNNNLVNKGNKLKKNSSKDKEENVKESTIQATNRDIEEMCLDEEDIHAVIESVNDANVLHAPLFKDVAVQASSSFKFVNLIKNDSQLNSMTGIENYNILNTIVNIVLVNYGDKYEKEDLKMNTTDRIVMTYMKLKQNLSYNFLAVAFSCYSARHCQRIFCEIIKVLSICLKVAIHWPSTEEVSKNLPKCFENFENVKVVLDCTEIIIQQPEKLCCQLTTYSDYKSPTTAKIMTGVTPAGNISYISKVYGGRVSDSAIFAQSDLLNLLEPGDGIMVDRGFLIDELCHKNRWKCIKPPFLQDKKQFSQAESILTSNIAAARVHIERLNQRIRTFRIVESKLPVKLLPILDDIFMVICATINISSPILRRNKFMKN